MRIRLVKTAAGSIHDGVLPVFVMHLSGLLPYFAQNPFNSIKFENFLYGLISARYKMCYSSNQEDAIILITNYHAKNTPKIWQYPLFSLLLQKEFKKQLGYGTNRTKIINKSPKGYRNVRGAHSFLSRLQVQS